MRTFADLTIRHKITAVILLITGAAVLFACAVLLAYQWYSVRDNLTRRLEVMAEVVAQQTTAALDFRLPDDATAILRALRAEPEIAVFALYDRDGAPFAQFLGEGIDGSAVPSRPGRDERNYVQGSFTLFAPVMHQSERVGTLYLRSDLRQLSDQLTVNVVVTFGLLAALAFVIVVASARVGRRIARPILSLATVVESVRASRNYALRVPPGNRDELGSLIEGLNEMLTAIESRDSALASARDDLERRVVERTMALEREVVDRRQAEVKLREKDALLTEAQDIAQLGSWEWSVATDRVAWSDEVHRIYGVMPQRFGGDYAAFIGCVHADERDMVDAAMKSARDSREGLALEYRVVRPDGVARFVSMRGKYMLDRERQVVRLVGTLQDVTARHEADLAVRRLNADLQVSMTSLATANKELEGFSYSVSHDLRAPLRAIAGFARILLDDHGAGLHSDAKRYLDVITKNVHKMGQLIDDLLAFSKLGRKAVQTASVDMQQLVEEVVVEGREANTGRCIDVKVGDLPRAVGDPAMLRQVMVNLVSNAMKYSRGREPALVEIDGQTEADVVVYRIRDNGAGFDMAYAEKLFGVFQRLHSSSEFEGTGVGLALVQRIVQRHGGRVWAEGKVGVGATFTFALPRTQAETSSAGARPS